MDLEGFPLCMPELQKLIFSLSGTGDSIGCENRVLGRFGSFWTDRDQKKITNGG